MTATKFPRKSLAQLNADKLVNAIEFAVFKGEEVNAARNRLMNEGNGTPAVWALVDAKLDELFA